MFNNIKQRVRQGVKRGIARKVTEGAMVLGLAGLIGNYAMPTRAEVTAETSKPAAVETKQTAEKEDYSYITNDWNPITRAFKISRHTIFERDTFEYLGISGLVMGGGIVTDLDEEVYENLNEDKIFSESVEDLLDGFGYVGGIGTSLSLQAIGHLRGDDKMKMAGRAVGDATLTTSSFGLLVRQTVGRNDPEDGKGAKSFEPFDYSLDVADKDFFAGHVGAVAAGARVLQRFYPDSKLIPIIGYGLTGATLLAKTQSGDHWLTGNVAGVIMGIKNGDKTADVYLEGKESAWSFVPTTSSSGKPMIALTKKF